MTTPNGPTTNTEIALSPRQERAIAARDAMQTGGAPAPLVPTTFLEAQAFCGALAESNLIPDALKKRAPDILVIVLAGIELGLSPMQSIRLHHVIEGVPRLSSAGIAGIVMASPLCEYLRCVESTELRSTWVTKRVGEPEKSCTWTIQRAQTAGLAGKGTWQKYPNALLNGRCRKELCEMVYPDLCAGLLSAEEAEDMAGEAARREPVAFTAPPVQTAPPAGATVTESAGAAPTKGKKAKAGTIDTTATERPTPPPPSDAGASGSGATTSNGSAAPSAASTASKLDEAVARVEEKKLHIVKDRFGQIVSVTDVDPTATSSASPASSSSSGAPASSESKASTSTEQPANSASSSAAPANETAPDAFDDPEDSEPEYTAEGFYDWLASCKPPMTQAQLSVAAAPWVKWSGGAYSKNSPELIAIREAYRKQKALLPE